jgi:hypothetical protein
MRAERLVATAAFRVLLAAPHDSDVLAAPDADERTPASCGGVQGEEEDEV